LVFLKTHGHHLPAGLGLKDGVPEHHVKAREKLEELREKMVLNRNAYFDVDTFSGENGIPPTTIFDPLFPDTFSFLHLGEGEMIELDGEVWGVVQGNYQHLGKKGEKKTYTFKNKKDPEEVTLKEKVEVRNNYLTAEDGWSEILNIVFGGLPPEVTHEMILESSGVSKDGGKPEPGYIDKLIKAYGMAKMFPGNQVRQTLTPFLTEYILELFARYEASPKYRDVTFKELVHKLKGASEEGGGLSQFKDEVNQVIKNISDPTGKPGERMAKTMYIGDLQRAEQRRKYVDFIYHERHLDIPHGNLTISDLKRAFVNRVGTPNPDYNDYLDMVFGRKGLPESGVVRSNGNLDRIKESSGKH
jgi:hypothetical protein